MTLRAHLTPYALAIVLVSGVLAVVPPDPTLASAGEDAVPGERSSGTIESARVDARTSAVAAARTARIQGSRVEILEERTDSTRTFVNPDGSWSTEADSGPVRVQEPDGSWTPIDTTLEQEPDGDWVPHASASDVVFSNGGTEPFATMEPTTGTSVGLTWPEALPKPVVAGSRLTYPDVVANGDLVVEALPGGFSHSIVLHAAPEQPVDYQIPLELNGLTLIKESGGALSVQTEAGREVAAAPQPVIFDDQTATTGEPENVAPLTTTVDGTGEDAQLTLSPDQQMLQNPETQYPVTIDPTFNETTTGDTWVQNSDYTSAQTGSTELRAGTYDGGGHKARSFIRFNISALRGKHILSATLRLRNHYSGSCTAAKIEAGRINADWTAANLTWGNQPTVSLNDVDTFGTAYGYTGCPDAGWATWNVASIVRGWADGTWDNNGFRLRAYDETNSNSWRKYRSANFNDDGVKPRLVVDYNSFPGAPTELDLSPVAGTLNTGLVSRSASPELTADARDVDGGRLRMDFEVWGGSAASPSSRLRSGSVDATPGTVASWKPSALQEGTYNYRVRAWDGTDFGAWSDRQQFNIDLTAPDQPDLSSSTHSSSGTWYPDATVQLAWSPNGSNDVVGYSLLVDGSPTSVAARTISTTSRSATVNPSSGIHWAHLRSVDKAGNWSATSHFKFQVDSVAPGAPVITSSTHSVSSAAYGNSDFTASWTPPVDVSGIAGYSVIIDNQPGTLPPSSVTQVATQVQVSKPSGRWYVHVRAQDGAGNWSLVAQHYSFWVDTNLTPDIVIASTSHPDEGRLYASSAFEASFRSSSDDVTGYAVALDQNPASVPTAVSQSGSAYSATLADGEWYLHVRAEHSDGGLGAVSHFRVQVDTTTPKAPSVTSEFFDRAGAWVPEDTLFPGFAVAVENPMEEGVSYSLDGDPFKVATSALILAGDSISPGWHELLVRTTDRAGNASDVVKRTFGVGSASVMSPQSEASIEDLTSLDAVLPEESVVNGVWYQYRLDGWDEFSIVPDEFLTTATGDMAVQPLSRSASNGALTWDVASTIAMSEEAAVSADIEVRACFLYGAEDRGCTGPAGLHWEEPPSVTIASEDGLTAEEVLDVVDELDVDVDYAASVIDTGDGETQTVGIGADESGLLAPDLNQQAADTLQGALSDMGAGVSSEEQALLPDDEAPSPDADYGIPVESFAPDPDEEPFVEPTADAAEDVETALGFVTAGMGSYPEIVVEDPPQSLPADLSIEQAPTVERSMESSCSGSWLPRYAKLTLAKSALKGRRWAGLEFVYSSKRLQSLKCRNKGLEPDIVGNNHDRKKKTKIIGDNVITYHVDQTYLVPRQIRYWTSNMPKAYKDTFVLDNKEEPTWTIGNGDTSKLRANKTYNVYIRTGLGNDDVDTVKLN